MWNFVLINRHCKSKDGKSHDGLIKCWKNISVCSFICINIILYVSCAIECVTKLN